MAAGAPVSWRAGHAGDRVYLADTLGEMGLFLRLADVAIVGNGFPRNGEGHNPLEPARLGVGAISGPEVANFADIYAEMAAAGAAVIASDEAGLTALLAELFTDRPRLAAMGEAALAFAQAQGDQLAPRWGDPAAVAGGMRLATPRWWYVQVARPRP